MTVTPEDFWKRIQKPVDCWLYSGAKEVNGYGYLTNPFPDGTRFVTAHRLAWIFTNGPVPEGLQVLHHCDIRACVNPEHLFLGTIADNSADKIHKGRFHSKLTADQVREIKRLFPTVPQKDIAAQFNVGASAISAIYTGKRWTHIV